MQAYLFDDRNVTWQTIDYIGAQIHVLAVDDARAIADVLIRFQPDTPGRLHRHVCDFSTFVLQGDLQFWRPDGSLKEVRPTGSYVQVAANGEPHLEGAGDQMAIVLFSFRVAPCPACVRHGGVPCVIRPGRRAGDGWLTVR